MDEVGTDIQFLSPRPFHLMHSERPGSLVRDWVGKVNDLIARQVGMFPARFAGLAGLPQSPEDPPREWVSELDRCVNGLGFVGCLLNPDPSEGEGTTPPMGDPYWYPVYEKLVELNIPALVHSAACKNTRESYSNHFITEEGIAILSILKARLFERFPTLKLIVSHGGGSIPFQIGRWRADAIRSGHPDTFDQQLRRLYFDTVLYNAESIEFLIKIVGADRCLFGTERPGTGHAKDPETGRWLDDLRPFVEQMPGLTDREKSLVLSENALQLFTRFRPSRTS
jgi:4-oxalmesaconate hydratase